MPVSGDNCAEDQFTTGAQADSQEAASALPICSSKLSSPRITLNPSTLNWSECHGFGEFGSEALAIRLWWYGIIVVENVYAEEIIRKKSSIKPAEQDTSKVGSIDSQVEGTIKKKKERKSWYSRRKKSISSLLSTSGVEESSACTREGDNLHGETWGVDMLTCNSDEIFRCPVKEDDCEDHIHVSPKKTNGVQRQFPSNSLDTWVTATAPIFEDCSDNSDEVKTAMSFDSVAEGARLSGLVRAFSLLVGARETASHENRVVRERLNDDIANVKALMEETEDGRYRR
jgi:hypothetical protein